MGWTRCALNFREGFAGFGCRCFGGLVCLGCEIHIWVSRYAWIKAVRSQPSYGEEGLVYALSFHCLISIASSSNSGVGCDHEPSRSSFHTAAYYAQSSNPSPYPPSSPQSDSGSRSLRYSPDRRRNTQPASPGSVSSPAAPLSHCPRSLPPPFHRAPRPPQESSPPPQQATAHAA